MVSSRTIQRQLMSSERGIYIGICPWQNLLPYLTELGEWKTPWPCVECLSKNQMSRCRSRCCSVIRLGGFNSAYRWTPRNNYKINKFDNIVWSGLLECSCAEYEMHFSIQIIIRPPVACQLQERVKREKNWGFHQHLTRFIHDATSNYMKWNELHKIKLAI